MDGWSVYYTTMGGEYVLPADRCLTIETGQGWHSGPYNRGLMSVLAHLAGRLLLGRKTAPDTGRVRFNLFHISSVGMEIIKKCKAFTDGQPFVSNLVLIRVENCL